MTRKYDRELKEVERLQLENRELKSRVRQLEKRVKRLNKGFNRLDELNEDAEFQDAKEIIVDVTKRLCYSCLTGDLELIKMPSLGRYIRICNQCGKRTKAKLLSELKE